MSVALVTDSSSQIPTALRDRYDVRVVPLTIVVDGDDHVEGVDLTNESFYDRLGDGAEVSTAAPSPGRFVEAYEAAAVAGADQIISIHIGSNTSATLDSARVAARMSPVPVELVDTATASFPVACCVWAAGAVLANDDGNLAGAVAAARAVAEHVDNVFVVGALDLARRGGRLEAGAERGDGLPVLALRGGTMDVVGHVHDLEDAVDSMVAYVRERSGGRAQRVGVGDALAGDLAAALARDLEQLPEVGELVRYEIGPSVGAHTGPGTAGCVFFPVELVGELRRQRT